IQSDPLLANFKLTLAFNGVGTTGNTEWTGLPSPGVANDDLTMNVQNYQPYFHWISHTYDHPNSLNGLHKSDPYGDPSTPQMDSIDLEILTNQYVANGTGQNLDPDTSDTVRTLHFPDVPTMSSSTPRTGRTIKRSFTASITIPCNLPTTPSARPRFSIS